MVMGVNPFHLPPVAILVEITFKARRLKQLGLWYTVQGYMALSRYMFDLSYAGNIGESYVYAYILHIHIYKS